jgi:hypothetical protein
MARREVESQRDVEEIYVLILFSFASSFFVLGTEIYRIAWGTMKQK